MESSLRFYVDGLGFKMKNSWVPEGDSHYPSDGKIRWCCLELGDAVIMLQEFPPQGRPKETLGADASVTFMCEDALALYREFKARGVQTRNRPFVGNNMWVIPLTDPDGIGSNLKAPPMRRKKASLKSRVGAAR